MEENEILDTSVALAAETGTITALTVIEHPPVLNKFFEIIFPETADYVKAFIIAGRLRERGTPVGAVDILIAAIALNRSLPLRTTDRDFAAIQKVCPELIMR